MYNKVLNIGLYSICLNIFFTPWANNLATLFGYISIISLIMYPILQAYQSGRLVMNYYVFWIMCVFFISMITSIDYFSPTEISHYVISFFSFISVYWALSFAPEEKSGLFFEDLFKINYFLCFIFILFTFGPFSFKYMIVNDWGTKVFNMGLGNPNAVSAYVMFSVAVLVMQLLNLQRIVRKIINAILIGILIYIIFMLSSRTVLFCVIVILLYGVFHSRRRIGTILPYIAMVIPFLMIAFQMIIGKRNSTFEILGKSINTGRAAIYGDLLADVSKDPLHFLFGRFFEYPLENMHNAPLTILATLGIVGVILYFLFWICQVRIMNKHSNTPVQILAFASILVFFVHSSSEAMLMVGTIPYGVFTLLLVKIAKGEYQYKYMKH